MSQEASSAFCARRRVLVAVASFIVLVACGQSHDPHKSAPEPTIAFEKVAEFVPGTTPDAIRAKLTELGAGVTYRTDFHDVVMMVNHPWIWEVRAETDSSSGVVQDVVFHFRPGVLTPKNVESIADLVDALDDDLAPTRTKKMWDAVKGTFTYQWGESEFRPDVTLYLNWEPSGMAIQSGSLTICFSKTAENFAACSDMIEALVATDFPDPAGTPVRPEALAQAGVAFDKFVKENFPGTSSSNGKDTFECHLTSTVEGGAGLVVGRLKGPVKWLDVHKKRTMVEANLDAVFIRRADDWICSTARSDIEGNFLGVHAGKRALVPCKVVAKLCAGKKPE